MEQKMDDTIVGREGLGPFQHAIRIALVVYLSPVILLVMAIGVVGMLAAKVAKPVARIARAGVHSKHEPAAPLGILAQNRPTNRTAAIATTRSSVAGRSKG
jgi:hypothetical protein